MKKLATLFAFALVAFTANAQDVKTDDYSIALARVQLNDKWGFIDKKGHEVIKCIYDEVVGFYDDTHCKVKLNGEEFWINANGIRVQNCPFDDIQ